MKLILCKNCQDVVRLFEDHRSCKCGKCGGRYMNDLVAVYWGQHAVPLGFDNDSLVEAVKNQPLQHSRVGPRFTAFVIPMECVTFRRITEAV